MTNVTDVYQELEHKIKNTFNCDLSLFYTKDSRSNHMFCIVGYYEYMNKDNKNLFEFINQLTNKYPDINLKLDSSSSGVHIRIRFNKNDLDGNKPESAKSHLNITHNGRNDKTECSNCLVNTSNLPNPPLKLYYPTNKGETPNIEKHRLCVDCSPGHYDDVVRTVDRFLVENGKITKVGLKCEGESWGDDSYIEWKNRSDISPYTKDTIETVEKFIIEKDHI